MTHTPGPWRVEKNRAPNGGTYYRIYDREEVRNCIAQVIGDGRVEYHANAHLIAAAPDLLAQLTYVVRYAEKLEKALGHTTANVSLDNAKQAIAKAEGRTK